MTVNFRTLTATLLFLAAACTAEGDDNYSPYLGVTELDYIGGPAGPKTDNRIPYFGGADYEYIGRTEFDENHLHGQHLAYRVGKVNLGSVCHYNKCCDEGLALGLTY